YKGTEILLKNGVGSYIITYTADSKAPKPEECTVKSIVERGFSEKYSPQIIIAGMDISRISDEEFFHLAALDDNEYLTTGLITHPHGNDGYVSLNYKVKSIVYYEKDNPDDMKTIEELTPLLIKTELRLPEDYNAESVSENKEELRDFALEYFTSNNETYTFYVDSYRETAKTTVNDLYSTAYEFLADDSDEYNAICYELTEIESLTKYDINNQRIDTGYLRVTAECCIEGYDEPVRTDMILKAGDRLGDALIIRLDL
ncbi:MAG: hypothetical protein K2J72_07385, partial [Oscillospiraceae bacterium]|nr:hypothetical protein [Oscillospiraceae bacterium]